MDKEGVMRDPHVPSWFERSLVAGLAVTTAGCVTATARVGEVDHVEEVTRLVPALLDTSLISADRITLVSTNEARTEVTGSIRRLDDTLVVRRPSGDEDLVLVSGLAWVELAARREVTDVVRAEAVNYWGLAVFGVAVVLPFLTVLAIGFD